METQLKFTEVNLKHAPATIKAKIGELQSISCASAKPSAFLATVDRISYLYISVGSRPSPAHSFELVKVFSDQNSLFVRIKETVSEDGFFIQMVVNPRKLFKLERTCSFTNLELHNFSCGLLCMGQVYPDPSSSI